MWIVDPRKTGDVDNEPQKNSRCVKWILEKQEMWIMHPRETDVDNGSQENRRFG